MQLQILLTGCVATPLFLSTYMLTNVNCLYIYNYTFLIKSKHIGIQLSLKKIVSKQYREIVDQSTKFASGLSLPREGWIRTVRKALGMSTVQLASRLNVTRALISRTEHQELNGGVTMKTMNNMAAALGCRFIYAIVPDGSIEDLILKQARLKAKDIVDKANVQMGMEEQLLSREQIEFEVERLARQMMNEGQTDLWDSKEKSHK